MEELVNLITQNGIGVVCVGFLIYFINTTLKDNTQILNDVKETLISIQSSLLVLTNRVDEIESKIKKK
jgi:hypothetical protein